MKAYLDLSNLLGVKLLCVGEKAADYQVEKCFDDFLIGSNRR